MLKRSVPSLATRMLLSAWELTLGPQTLTALHKICLLKSPLSKCGLHEQLHQ